MENYPEHVSIILGDVTGNAGSKLLKEPPNTAEHQQISNQSEAVPAKEIITTCN